MRPTIKTIANLAGVSRGTVDRVLNNRPNVRPDKQEKVLEAIRQLNYKPNMAARALAMNNKQIKLGILYPAWTGHFAEEVLRGIEDVRNDTKIYGVQVIERCCQTNLPEDFVRHIDFLLGQDVKGLAVCAINSISVREKILEAARAGITVVTFNSDVLDSGRACFVGQDRVKSGRIAAELMAKLVDGRGGVIAAAGNLEFNGHRDRAMGFCGRWQELGLGDLSGSVLQTFNDYDMTYEKISAALARNPNIWGVYMGNEDTPGCVEAIRRAALPHKVKLVTHDLSASHSKLLLSGDIDFIIEQNMYFQGYRPIEILTQMLIGGEECPTELEHTPIKIITAENIE